MNPAYGIWQMCTPPPRTLYEDQHDLVEVLARDGAVIELPPLKTREGRLQFYHGRARHRISFREIGHCDSMKLMIWSART